MTYDAVVYSKADCPWCVKAIQLLQDNGFSVQELKLNVDYTKSELETLLGNPKKVTVPQIFIDNQPLGGYDHMRAYFSMTEEMKKAYKTADQ